MSHAPYPALADERGVVSVLQQEFVRPLRQPLAGFALFAGKETRSGHWGIERVDWKTVSELDSVVVSMDLPPISGDSGTVSTKSVEIPILTKDLTMGGRKWRQMQATGQFDTVAVQELGWAMARDMNSALLTGFGAGLPGPDTGLLNDAAAPAAITGGDWGTHLTGAGTDPEGVFVMNDDLGAGLAALYDRDIAGGATLLIDPVDAKILNRFIPAAGGQRIGDNLPGGISRILWDKSVGTGNAYLVADMPGTYDVVMPQNEDGMTFGLGTVTADIMNPAGGLQHTTQTRENDLMKSRVIRFLNMMAPRMIRTGSEHPVQKITFTP